MPFGIFIVSEVIDVSDQNCVPLSRMRKRTHGAD